MYMYVHSLVATKCLSVSDRNSMWWIWLSDVWRRCWVLSCKCTRLVGEPTYMFIISIGINIYVCVYAKRQPVALHWVQHCEFIAFICIIIKPNQVLENICLFNTLHASTHPHVHTYTRSIQNCICTFVCVCAVIGTFVYAPKCL